MKKIFEDIADGAPPYLVPTDDGAVRRPTLLCAGTESPGIPADVHEFCSHNTNFVSTDHGHITFICPGWYDLPMPPRVCPRVGRSGTMLHNGNWMAQHKVGILIHELAHVYVGLYHPDEFAEAYDLQSCLDLNEEDSVKNAQSYATYAMCKYPSSVEMSTEVLLIMCGICSCCQYVSLMAFASECRRWFEDLRE